MSCLSSSSSIGSQAREGVARVRFENPPCYGGQSRRCAEVSLLYTGQSRRRAEGVSGTRRVQRLMNRPALSVTPAFLLQDGRQDARCGQDARRGQNATGGQNARCRQPAKCMRWTKRKVPAAGKMHEVDKTQGSGKTQDGRQDARRGQPAKCMRRARRKGRAASKTHGAEKARSKENTRRKTTGAARCWAHNPLHESTKKIAPCARILYNTFIRSLAAAHCRVVAPSD